MSRFITSNEGLKKEGFVPNSLSIFRWQAFSIFIQCFKRIKVPPSFLFPKLTSFHSNRQNQTINLNFRSHHAFAPQNFLILSEIFNVFSSHLVKVTTSFHQRLSLFKRNTVLLCPHLGRFIGIVLHPQQRFFIDFIYAPDDVGKFIRKFLGCRHNQSRFY